MGVLKSLDLQSNLLGQDYTSRVDFKYPTETKTPPICILTDLLMKSHSLKDLNISNNSMGGNAALSIAHGLTHTQQLESIDISGNPIGKLGMKMIMQSMNSNVHTKFTINLKDISADKEIKLNNDSANSSINFDPSNPEGNFTLDLIESYN